MWLSAVTNGKFLSEADFLVPRLTLGGLAILRERFTRPARLRILLPVGPVLRDVGEAPRYRLLASTPAELILDNQLTQGVDARRLHRWLASEAVEVRAVASDSALPWMVAVDGALLVGNVELTRECLDPAYVIPQAGLFALDETSRAALSAVYGQLWARGRDVKGRLRAALAALYAPNAPSFIYFLSLWHLFHDLLDGWRGGNENLRKTPIWKALYAFQRHGAIAALRKLKQERGCILADSVGLGKTYTTLAVVKAYDLMSQRVLVLCPKKLRTNWARFLQDDDYNPFLVERRADFRYALLNHTDLSQEWVDPGRGMRVRREDFFRGDFGLIVIDESHNFRNRGGKRYQFLLAYLKAHPETRVLMLSATPVSNRLTDLIHQLGLACRGDEPPSGAFLREVVSVVRAAQRSAAQWTKTHADEPEALSAAVLANVLPEAYFRLLERYTIARSRGGIAKSYADAQSEIGTFPACETLSCHPGVDSLSGRLDVATLSDRLNDLSLAAYNPTHFLRAGIRWHEEEEGKKTLRDKDRQKSLVALMRINALKRLESSVDSFRKTVREAILARTRAQLEALAQGKVRVPWVTAKALLGEAEARRQARAVALGVDPDTLDEDDEALGEALAQREALLTAEPFDVASLRQGLTHDLDVLTQILEAVDPVGPARDAKLAELERVLSEKAAHPLNPGNEKALVFSAFADTVEYVAKALAERHPGRHIACVTGSKGVVWHAGEAKPQEMGAILRRFAPYAQCPVDPETGEPRRGREPEIDWVVATDCLSEGQNLQDCDMVVHYDIHWNPLRLTQRVGRIDRIGSRNARIRNVLFWPCKDLSQYIDLERKVRAKIAVGSTVAPLDNEDRQDLAYRERQLQAIQRSRFDMDAFFSGGGVFDEYLADLDTWLRADKTRERRCREAPLGLCAVAPAILTEAFAKSGLPVPTRGGVLFLLRRGGLSEAEAKVNLFRECFLLAVDLSGKPIGAPRKLSQEEALALFRALCRDRETADPALAACLERLGPKTLTPALEGALAQLGVARETNRARLLLGDEPFDFHTGLTDDRAALTLLTFALFLPEANTP